jgi:hypothetical protein
VEKRAALGEGLGATWEGQLVFNAIYGAQCINRKFVPIVLSRSDVPFIPSPLQSFQHYVLDTDEGFFSLYRLLTDQPHITRPKLGQVRSLPIKRRRTPEGEMKPLEAEVVTTATLSHTLPTEIPHEIWRDGVIRTLQALSTKFDVVILDGVEGSGKTTALRQFVLNMPEDCISVFFAASDRSSYDPENVQQDLLSQAKWLLDRVTPENQSNRYDLQSCFQRLNVTAKRRRKPFYIVLDGLDEVSPQIPGGLQAILDLFPEPGLSSFRFLASDEKGKLKGTFGTNTRVQTFPMLLFGLDDAARLFENSIADPGSVNEITQLCEGNPGLLSSVRRLLDCKKPISSILTALSGGQNSFELEWSFHKPFSEPEQRLLAYLAFDDNAYTVAQLCAAAKIDEAEVVRAVERLSFLEQDSRGHKLRFKSSWFRATARNELERFRRAVHKNIAKQLIAYADPDTNLSDIALHYAESAEYGKVLSYVSAEHLTEVVRRAKSFARIQRTLQIALDAARRIDREPEIIRFVLANAILADFSGFGIAANEVSAWAALRRFDMAVGIARAAPLKEDKLHLLAIVANAMARTSQPLPEEIHEQITLLAREVDVAVLGRRTFQICADLISALPEVALDLAEKAEVGDTARERIFTHLSLIALDFQSGDSEPDALEKIKARGITFNLEGIRQALSSVSQKWSCEEVLAQASKIERTRDRLYLLRSWTASSGVTDEFGTVIESALNLAITATDYTVDARVLRDLAEGLHSISDISSLSKLIGMFDAQRGAAARLGPSLDYVRMQLLLAENELRLDAAAVETRLLSLFYELPQIPDLAVRAEAYARLLSALARLFGKTSISLIRALINDSTKELEDSVIKLLDSTADHRRAATGVICAVAEWNINKAIELSSMLNTENRRDLVLLDMAKVIFQQPGNPKIADLKLLMEHCADRDIRDQLVTSALSSIEQRAESRSDLGLVKDMDWLYERAKTIRSAPKRTKALCCVYKIASCTQDSCFDLPEVGSALMGAWKSISSAHVRVKHGFRIVGTLASSATDLAQEYLEATQLLRRDIGGLSSPKALRVYISSVRLAARAFSGLTRKQNDTKRDLDLLAIQIDRVPSFGERAMLWSEVAVGCAAQGDVEICKELVTERIRPLLHAIDTDDATYLRSVKAEVFPAVFLADTAAAYALLVELDGSYVNHALFLTTAFLFRNVPPYEPEHYVSGKGYEVTYSRLQHICDLADKASADWLIFRVVERAIDSLLAKKNEDRLKAGQKDEIFRRLVFLVDSKLPDVKHIRHDGYKIVARFQLNRYRTEYHVDQLLGSAKAIPNVADRSLVLFYAGATIYRYDRSNAQVAISQALTLARDIASKFDQIERLLWFAEMANASRIPNTRAILLEAARIAQNPHEEISRKIRRLIDVAYEIQPEFASEVADLLDDDKAKRNAQEEIAVLKAKQRVIDEESITDTVQTASARDYISLGEKLLGLLQSERIDSIHGSSVLKSLEVVSKQPLSVSYFLMAWALQNAVDKHADTSKAGYYLRPLFESALSCCQLAGELAEQALSKQRQFTKATPSNDSAKEGFVFSDRQSLLTMVTRWISQSAAERIILADSGFGREELEFLRLVRAANPSLKVSILTCKASQNHTPGGEELGDAYARFWKEHISEQKPPFTRVFLLSTDFGENPQIDCVILAESSGLRFQRTFGKLGSVEADSVLEIDAYQSEDLRRIIESYCSGEAIDSRGNRIRCSSFSL